MGMRYFERSTVNNPLIRQCQGLGRFLNIFAKDPNRLEGRGFFKIGPMLSGSQIAR